jgi:hypothetical protein
MGWTDHHALHGRHLYPTTGGPAAGKDKRIYVITLDDRNLEVAVVWSCRYFFPNWLVVHRFNLSAAGVASTFTLPLRMGCSSGQFP